MHKVVCSGAKNNPKYHQCEKRKCPHRKLHITIKNRCGIRDFNGNDCWCIAPNTTSLLDGDNDGALVSCLSPQQIDKENKELTDYIKKLHELHEPNEPIITHKNDITKQIGKILETPFWPKELTPLKKYFRTHDDCAGEFKGISVKFTEEGDACITTCHEGCRFRTFGGGGRSLRVRNALLILALAIKFDNEQYTIIKD